MRVEKITADRLTAFSDAVFAVIVTVMVLELRAPDKPAFSDLFPVSSTLRAKQLLRIALEKKPRRPRPDAYS